MRRLLGGLAFLGVAACASMAGAERFDYIVGADAPAGGAYLIKRIAVAAAAQITAVELVTNDPAAVFPSLSVFADAADLESATLLVELQNISAAGASRVRAAFEPVAVGDGAAVLVAVELPAVPACGIAAQQIAGASGSYFVSHKHGAFGELGVDLAIALGLDAGAGPAPEASPPSEVPARTFLRVRRPAAGESLVQFGLTRAGDVELSIIDVRGRLVRTVERGRLQAGTYTRTWDGHDGTGARVARGVYLVRLVASGEHLSSKIAVTR